MMCAHFACSTNSMHECDTLICIGLGCSVSTFLHSESWSAIPIIFYNESPCGCRCFHSDSCIHPLTCPSSPTQHVHQPWKDAVATSNSIIANTCCAVLCLTYRHAANILICLSTLLKPISFCDLGLNQALSYLWSPTKGQPSSANVLICMPEVHYLTV